jgi:phosphate transport system protein
MFEKFKEAWRSKGLLNQALEKTQAMIETVAKTYSYVREYLLRGVKPDVDVYGRDRYVNTLNREIRRLIAEHLVLKPGDDPVAGLVLLNVNIDLERVGDFTKNMHEVAEAYAGPITESKYHRLPELLDIEGLVKQDFALTLKAFSEFDSAAARQVCDNHRKLAPKTNELINELFVFTEVSVKDAVMAVLVCRYTKRINAHLMNVASTIINPFDWVSYQYDGDPADAKELD